MDNLEATEATPARPTDSGQPLPTNLVGVEVGLPGLVADKSGKQEAGWLKRKFGISMPSAENVELGHNIAILVLRVVMSGLILWLVWWWLHVVKDLMTDAVMNDKARPLSDGVWVALLTTTTFNVLVPLYFVANFLFPKNFPNSKGDLKGPTPPSAPTPPV